jgi:hypothetical protein
MLGVDHCPSYVPCLLFNRFLRSVVIGPIVAFTERIPGGDTARKLLFFFYLRIYILVVVPPEPTFSGRYRVQLVYVRPGR